MLKADLHLHCKGDPADDIEYTAKELIDEAARQRFNVLAITLHRKMLYNELLVAYAKRKGILLIPGKESKIEGKDVLVYNYSREIKKINELSKVKTKGGLVIAPHPYFVHPICLGNKLEENIEMFDAIEYSHYYVSFLNRNKKAEKIAKKYGKPLIGTSDAHNLNRIGYTYTLIDAQMNVKSVLDSIRKGKTKLITRPIPIKMMIGTAISHFAKKFIRLRD